MLDIIVTHYKEPWKVGKPLFDMLGLQRGIDFSQIRVILVNDGEDNHLPNELFKDYPYRFEQIDIPHGGVSAARNAGIDHATAEWINFCDFDDTYSNCYALRDVLNVLPNDKYDMLWTQLMTEDFTNGKDNLIMTPEKSAFVFIHGKYYRRQWLVENKVRFDETLTFQEDSLFNAIIIAILDYHRIGRIRSLTPPYIWCRRGDSVTNSQETEDKATMFHFIRNRKVCDFYRENLSRERISDMVVRSVYDAYHMANSKDGVSANFHYQLIKGFKEFIGEYDEYYSRPDDDTLRQIAEISRYELADREIPDDFKTVTAWKNAVKGEI